MVINLKDAIDRLMANQLDTHGKAVRIVVASLPVCCVNPGRQRGAGLELIF